MAREKRQTDGAAAMQAPRLMLFLAVFALVLVGLVMVYSASSASLAGQGADAAKDAKGQLVFVIAGVACMLLVWKGLTPAFWLSSPALSWIVWAVCIALLAAVALFGEVVYGAKRWLSIGPVSTQPSEIVKIGLLFLAVRLMSEWQAGTSTGKMLLIKIILWIAVPLAVLYTTQSDLGTTAICAVGMLAIMWLGGAPRRWVVAVVILGVLAVAYAIFGTDYRSGRMVYLNPWDDGEGGYGTGYNIIRSYYALATGGLFGVGLGNSHEKFDYLFASDCDFIFSVIGEELGMVGALAVIALFLVVLFAGLRIANAAPNDMGAMVAGGLSIMLVFQAFLNIGCAIGVFPTTGKPLPFISSGGTSMIASFITIGFILAVSDEAAAPSVYEQRRADLRVVRADEPRPSVGADRSAQVGAAGRTQAPDSHTHRGSSSRGRSVRGRAHAEGTSRSRRFRADAGTSAREGAGAGGSSDRSSGGTASGSSSRTAGRGASSSRSSRGALSSEFARIEMPRSSRR